MRVSLIWSLCICSLVLGCNERNPERDLAELTSAIPYKSPDEMRQVIVARLGENSRHVGSGFDIEEWDFADGVLTFHPVGGVYFEKDGVRQRLLKTTNRLGECIFGEYEMTTQANERETCFWIGNVQVYRDGSYQYTDSESNFQERGNQDDNFFINHPIGTAKTTFADGLADDSVLEQLSSGRRVATIEFRSSTADASATYFVVCDTQSMRLAFDSDTPQPFQMDKGWEHYWNDEDERSSD